MKRLEKVERVLKDRFGVRSGHVEIHALVEICITLAMMYDRMCEDKWENEPVGWKCPHCGTVFFIRGADTYKYCPRCGLAVKQRGAIADDEEKEGCR